MEFYANPAIGQAARNRGWAPAPDRLPGANPAQENVAIEGLRGLAALMVVAAHFAALFVSDGRSFKFATTGVNLFFVLSGFVFAPYLLGRPLPLLPHLVRRFFRLYPLYLLALLAYAVAKEPATTAWLHFPAHLFMAHTFRSVEIAVYYNPAFWSLPPEVEFYLLLPLLVRWGGVRALVLLLALSVFSREWLFLTATGNLAAPGWREIASVHLPGLLCEFMLGAFSYILGRRCTMALQRIMAVAAGLCFLALVAAVFLTGGDGEAAPVWVRGNITLFAAVGYAFVVAAFSGCGASLSGGWRTVLITAGHLSYGVYLFHNLAPPLLRRVFPGLDGQALGIAALAFTFLLALVAHHLLEEPLRALGRRLSDRLRPARS